MLLCIVLMSVLFGKLVSVKCSVGCVLCSVLSVGSRWFVIDGMNVMCMVWMCLLMSCVMLLKVLCVWLSRCLVSGSMVLFVVVSVR